MSHRGRGRGLEKEQSKRDALVFLKRGIADYVGFLAESGVHTVASPPATPAKPPPALPDVLPGESETLFSPGPGRSAPLTLPQIREELGECTRCKLHAGRTHIVFGEGDPNAEILFIGEGPGADEDRLARPFVGRAGKLLTKIIEDGMKLRREDVYIANIVKCRPPGNRDPEKEEVATCKPFLLQQIRAIRPKVIVTLGRPATSTLLERTIQITRMRGQWQDFHGIPLMPTYHPAFVLRQYTEKTRREVWEDMKAVLEKIGKPLQ